MTAAFTLKYAPPEVCMESITDLKNDIWSLGLVMYLQAFIQI
jgi:serine/threonine protein kinase